MVTIRFYQETDQGQWDSYVQNHPRGTFFHLTGWKKVIEKTFHHKSFYLIAQENDNSKNSINSINPGSPTNSINSKDRVVGLLPLFSVKSILFGKSLVSLPFAAYGGILADDETISNLLLEKAKEMTKAQGLDYLELRNRNEKIEDLPAKDLYFQFRREIFEDLDSNMEAIPRKSRRMVRQGEKAGLTFEFGRENLVSIYYDIFAKSYHRLGSPVFPKGLFKNLLSEFKEKANILVAKTQEGSPIASVFTFFYRDEILPYYAGSLFEYRELAPNDYMYWQLMKYGCENGYRCFDFGRSKVDTGSYDFKRHWGFEPEPLEYQYYLSGRDEIPNLSPANPKYRKKIEIWQKLPFWATKVIGPRIVKYIP
jgi:FemAB-related protein (PEP-CTERM system-associated)